MERLIDMQQTARTVEFSQLPADARLWVFAATRDLSSAEQGRLLERVDRFLDEWNAHGHPVVGARDVRHDRFLLIAADERATGVSGCSIDSLYRVLKELDADLALGILDGSLVHYRDGEGAIRSVSRPDFRNLATNGEVDGDTIVFDLTIRSVAELAGAWEKPARDSWHNRAFLDPINRA